MEKTKSITVNLNDDSYTIQIGYDIYSGIPGWITRFTDNRQVAIITTPPVARYYLDTILKVFDGEWLVISYQVPDGESSKSMETVQSLYSWLIRNHIERNATIIALGGGVIGDLAGFVAATYLRGIGLVHLPTTLLAQVDSSIGGKVGVNHSLGKNLIGAFYQPKLVFSDVSVLNTLSDEEYICGMGEIIKYGFIYDEALFKRLEDYLGALLKRSGEHLFPVICRCAEIKAEVVANDVHEKNLRAILNFGHTFGHAFETYYQYRGLKHGQAVLLGMRSALEAARYINLIEDTTLARGTDLINRMQIRLPDKKRKPSVTELIELVKHDKKVKQGVVNLILLEGIGKAKTVPVKDEAILSRGFEAVMR